MEGIVVCLGRNAMALPSGKHRRPRMESWRMRYLIGVNVDEGRSVRDTARALGVAESTVRRVRQRFVAHGETGLTDHREENGQEKVKLTRCQNNIQCHDPDFTCVSLCLRSFPS